MTDQAPPARQPFTSPSPLTADDTAAEPACSREALARDSPAATVTDAGAAHAAPRRPANSLKNLNNKADSSSSARQTTSTATTTNNVSPANRSSPPLAPTNNTSTSSNERLSSQYTSNTSRVAPRTSPGTTTSQGPGAVTSTGTLSTGSLSLSTSRSPSTVTSPLSSRDSSPAGRVFRQQSVPGIRSAAQGMQRSKDSHDVSPHRPPSITGYTSSVPSAAAIQRALSAATAPQLQPSSTSDSVSRVPRPAKGGTGSGTPSEGNTPSWPISPRLKSPPPSGSRRNSLRSQRSEALAPNIVMQSATPTSSSDNLPLIDAEMTTEPRHSAPIKTNRGASGAPTLETVEETSGPNTPGTGLDLLTSNPDRKYFDMSEDDRRVPSGTSTPRRSMAAAISQAKGSNSDSDNGGKKDVPKKEVEADPEKTPRPKVPSTRTSFSSLRQKAGAEVGTRSMTVQTESIDTVPQNTIGLPSDRSTSRAEHGGTLRAKASNDTIRPSKSRKKASRKAPSITATGGMYEPFLMSPPPSAGLALQSPGKRRRRPHPLTLTGSKERPQQPHPRPSLSSLFDTVMGSDLMSMSSRNASNESNVPADAGRLQLLRRRSSQWLHSVLSRPNSPAKTDRHREASTRADIFEDRVKNAMDEATSDDSDETFVYESNPPEPQVRRSRHHSRTPSGASLVSMGGQNNIRPAQNMLNTQKTRSMKFANAYTSADEDAGDRQDGTIRASNASNRGSTVHHHHTGRPSRTTTGHASILDDDSPFPPLNKVRSLTGLPGRQTQNARLAARNLQAGNGNGNGTGNVAVLDRKNNGYMSYDLDAEGGDDERTPLISNPGTVRTPRSIRRPPTRGSRTDRTYTRRRQGMLTRFAGCIAIIAMLFLLVFGIVGFLFIITTPLTQVQIQEIQSVLASESEIMFDLQVGAVNPNLLPITVADTDLNVFAKSKFVGSEKWWRLHPDGEWTESHIDPTASSSDDLTTTDSPRNFLPSIPNPNDAFPDPDDPDNPGDGLKSMMLLGRVYHFDNPLSFDASFLKRHVHVSTGAVRISSPGNRTELGGSERWERVVLHEFDLIVRGTLKYTIPLGGKAYVSNVGARISVDPAKDEGPGPGEGKGDAPDGGDPPKKGKGKEGGEEQRWNLRVVPLDMGEELHPESVRERLRGRVWARVLRRL